jgi:5'(3')-deoxyribonucleotidase
MDHTFCDFNEAIEFWRERAKTDIEMKYPWCMKGFFLSLLPMEGAIEFWNKWHKIHDLWFLTRPSMQNLHCYTEKAEWIHKHLGDNGINKLILSPRKDILIGDILIDDDNRCGQPDFKGEWIQFGKNNVNWEYINKILHDKSK